MPIKVNYVENNCGVILDYSGEVTGNELVSVVTEVFDNDNFTSLKYWIADRTNCLEYDVDASHARTIAFITEINYLRNPNMLLALISPKDVEFGMSRMYQTFSGDRGFNTLVCHNRSEADEWISNGG